MRESPAHPLRVGEAHLAQDLLAAGQRGATVNAVGAAGFRRSGCVPARAGSATSSGPGRPSRSRRPGSSAGFCRRAGSRSRPAKVIVPPNNRTGGSGRSRSTERTVRLLPEPLSPTMPSFSPGNTSRSTPRTISWSWRCSDVPTCTSRSVSSGSLAAPGCAHLGSLI